MTPAAAPDPWHKNPWFTIVLGPLLAALVAGLLLQLYTSSAPDLVASYELHSFRIPAAYLPPLVSDTALTQRDQAIVALRGRLAQHSTQASFDSLPVALRLDLAPVPAIEEPGGYWYPAQYFDQVALLCITNQGDKAVEHYRIWPGHLVHYSYRDATEKRYVGYTRSSISLNELAPGETQFVLLWVPRADLLALSRPSQVLRALRVVWPEGETTALRAERVTGFWAWAHENRMLAMALVSLVVSLALVSHSLSLYKERVRQHRAQLAAGPPAAADGSTPH